MAWAAGDPGWRLLGALALAALVKAACGGVPTTKEDAVASGIASVLADFGPEVALPALARARAAAEGLQTATADLAAATAAGQPAEAERLAAQAAWWQAMAAWQEVELLQVGPLASSLSAVAGGDLRDEAYSWPTVNACRVDQETVLGEYGGADFFETRLVNVIGLDALEVLLYSPEGENHCPAQVDINADGSWEALGAAGQRAARAAYASALAEHLVATVGEAQQAYDPDGDDFSGELARAGEPGSPYASAEEGLNAIFHAAFYLETAVKDRKLGFALGTGACAEDSCLDEVESPLAGGSAAWIAINLRASRTLLEGGSGSGIADLLRVLGEEALADALLAALDRATLAAEALPGDLPTAMQADPAAVAALEAAVKEATDLLKGDVATVLRLQLPAEAAGDND